MCLTGGPRLPGHALQTPRRLQRLEEPIADLGTDFRTAGQNEDALPGQHRLCGDGDNSRWDPGEAGVVGQEPDQGDAGDSPSRDRASVRAWTAAR